MAVLGLTFRDCENTFWNSVSGSNVLFGGMAAAVAANALFQRMTPNEQEKGASPLKRAVCTVLGAGAGVLVSFYAASRVHCVQFAFEKAVKFFLLSLLTGTVGCIGTPLTGFVVWLSCQGGTWGYFGRDALRLGGALCAVTGSMAYNEREAISLFLRSLFKRN
jgi:hypothetical protein